VGAAKADSYRLGVAALGHGDYTAIQLTTTLAENKVKLVPDIAVGQGRGGSGLGDVLIARMLGAAGNGAAPRS
jgi:hypothetical protein